MTDGNRWADRRATRQADAAGGRAALQAAAGEVGRLGRGAGGSRSGGRPGRRGACGGGGGGGDKKTQVIKVVRELTGLGLKEAKSVADDAPKPVKEKVSKAEAQEMKKKLEEVGATIEIK